MSDERPTAKLLNKIEKALNYVLVDDLAYIDGLQWRADIERVAGKLDHKLNRALSDAGSWRIAGYPRVTSSQRHGGAYQKSSQQITTPSKRTRR